MFNEDNYETSRRGCIEVICGSMFSGKTEELLPRLKRAKFAKQRVEIFKPCIDTRYSETEVVSHDHNAIQSTPVESSQNILLMAGDVDVIGIDDMLNEKADIDHFHDAQNIMGLNDLINNLIEDKTDKIKRFKEANKEFGSDASKQAYGIEQQAQAIRDWANKADFAIANSFLVAEGVINLGAVFFGQVITQV